MTDERPECPECGSANVCYRKTLGGIVISWRCRKCSLNFAIPDEKLDCPDCGSLDGYVPNKQEYETYLTMQCPKCGTGFFKFDPKYHLETMPPLTLLPLPTRSLRLPNCPRCQGNHVWPGKPDRHTRKTAIRRWYCDDCRKGALKFEHTTFNLNDRIFMNESDVAQVSPWDEIRAAKRQVKMNPNVASTTAATSTSSEFNLRGKIIVIGIVIVLAAWWWAANCYGQTDSVNPYNSTDYECIGIIDGPDKCWPSGRPPRDEDARYDGRPRY